MWFLHGVEVVALAGRPISSFSVSSFLPYFQIFDFKYSVVGFVCLFVSLSGLVG